MDFHFPYVKGKKKSPQKQQSFRKEPKNKKIIGAICAFSSFDNEMRRNTSGNYNTLFSQRLWLFKSKGFPFQAYGSAGRAVSLLGFACGVTFQWVRNLGLTCPLVPQEAVRLPNGI
ncbi:MAG: hypothetical protein ACQEUT_05890 [Bacillota bacterium]